MLNKLIFDKGSFRDPDAKVVYYKDNVLRVVYPSGFTKFEFIKKILNLDDISDYVIATQTLDERDNEFKFLSDKTNLKFFKHKKIEYISYPYEWSFNRLKDAAIHQLNLHINLLNYGATLSDAYSYNVQFDFHKPKFIDVMSIKEYNEGEFWHGHKQFCESFLNPLLLKSKLDIDFNNWFKGNLEGIHTNEIYKVLKFRHFFSWNIFYNVFLLNYFETKSKNQKIIKSTNKRYLKKSYYLSILTNLLNYIKNLKSFSQETIWKNYSRKNSYQPDEKINKIEFITKFFQNNLNTKVIDLGCNNGEYSRLALKSGCKSVVGFDYDLNAIDEAYIISKKEKNRFLPLYFDATNPSSNIGWYQNERKGFNERSNFDVVLALAFEHHLAIAKNIPLEDVIKYIVSLGNRGIIEFVPKNDQTVKVMLAIKGDIFPEYNYENFTKILSKYAIINLEQKISNSGRVLFSFTRK